MKIIILLISSILTMTITHAEESPRARNFGEIMGRLMYNSFKGVTLGITDEAAKDIQKNPRTYCRNHRRWQKENVQKWQIIPC